MLKLAVPMLLVVSAWPGGAEAAVNLFAGPADHGIVPVDPTSVPEFTDKWVLRWRYDELDLDALNGAVNLDAGDNALQVDLFDDVSTVIYGVNSIPATSYGSQWIGYSGEYPPLASMTAGISGDAAYGAVRVSGRLYLFASDETQAGRYVIAEVTDVPEESGGPGGCATSSDYSPPTAPFSGTEQPKLNKSPTDLPESNALIQGCWNGPCAYIDVSFRFSRAMIGGRGWNKLVAIMNNQLANGTSAYQVNGYVSPAMANWLRGFLPWVNWPVRGRGINWGFRARNIAYSDNNFTGCMDWNDAIANAQAERNAHKDAENADLLAYVVDCDIWHPKPCGQVAWRFQNVFNAQNENIQWMAINIGFACHDTDIPHEVGHAVGMDHQPGQNSFPNNFPGMSNQARAHTYSLSNDPFFCQPPFPACRRTIMWGSGWTDNTFSHLNTPWGTANRTNMSVTASDFEEVACYNDDGNLSPTLPPGETCLDPQHTAP